MVANTLGTMFELYFEDPLLSTHLRLLSPGWPAFVIKVVLDMEQL